MGRISRQAIMRLGALHFVSGLLDAASAPVSESGLGLAGKGEYLLSRIRQVRGQCERYEPRAESEKELRRVKNAIEAMNWKIVSAWGENVDAREAVMAALDLVAGEQEKLDEVYRSTANSSPAFLEKRLLWIRLHELLMALLEHLDPDLDAVAVDRGAQVGEGLAAALREGA